MTRLSAEQLQALADGYRSGESIGNLAERFKITRKTVFAHVKNQGLPRRLPLLSPQDVEEAWRLYQDGHSLVRVAEDFPVSAQTIRNALLKAGYELRGAHD